MNESFIAIACLVAMAIQGFDMLCSIIRQKRQMARLHFYHQAIMEHCERMRSVWLPEYLELKAQGLREQAELRKQEKLRQAERLEVFQIQEIRHF